jgi:purine-binding chemotaxis protein CheW
MKNLKEESLQLIQLVGFKLGNEEFAVDISKVQEINRIMTITKIPNSQEFIEGVVNLRGKIVPIMNLRERLRMERKENDAHTKIIVTEIDGTLIGFVVDEVTEVLRISHDIIEDTPTVVTGVDREMISGVAKMDDRLLILLNLEKICKQEEIESLQQIEMTN